MTTGGGPTSWQEDAGHGELIEMLLAMAESEHRWGHSSWALDLLAHVESIVGTLPESHQRLRARCRRDARPAAFL